MGRAALTHPTCCYFVFPDYSHLNGPIVALLKLGYKTDMFKISNSRYATSLLITGLIIVFSLLNYNFARVVFPNADLCQSLNELPSIWRGNFTLNHWDLAADNFYLTDLPIFVILRYLFGFQPWLMYMQPVATYALLTLGAILLTASKRQEGSSIWPGTLAILYLFGSPFAPGMYITLSPDIHIATIVFCLYALLSISPTLGNKPLSPIRFILFIIFGTAAAASDPLAQYFFILPLCLTITIRRWLHRSMSFSDGVLLLLSIAVAICASDFPVLMAHNHGFSIQHTFYTTFVSDLPQLLTNAYAMIRGLQNLFIADPSQLDGFLLHHVIAWSRLFIFGLVGLTLGGVLWSMPRSRDNGVEEYLAISCCCLFLLDASSSTFTAAIENGANYPGTAMRYITPVFLFSAIIAAIKFQNWLSLPMKKGPRLALRSTALIFGMISIVGILQGFYKASRQPEGISVAVQLPVIAYLETNHLTYGVGDYWTSNLIPFLSRGKIYANPVLISNGQLVPFPWLTDMEPIINHRRPEFVVFNLQNGWNISIANVEKTYGIPAGVTSINGFEVVKIKPE